MILSMATRIGCGSWADQDYVGLLSPVGFPSELRLSAYAMWFDHVEVNASYYATPRKATVAQWVNNTPPGFLFDVRLHRAISMSPEKAAKDGRLLGLLMDGMEPLFQAKKFGAFLLVLSPFFSPGRHALAELDLLIEKLRPHALAIELRHAAWVRGKARATTLQYFRERKVTWVAVDMPRIEGADIMPPVDEVTQPELAYLRLHGRNAKWLEVKSAAERHAYFYDGDERGELVKRIRGLEKKAKEVRVVANNHFRDYAPKTALALKEALGQFDI
jgi:uncharacterized protein YecE (DUF72 family)